ncbi:MAG: hypothetical protein H0U57_00470 [Tatlockia sp.]|nr:hypothetical protein [Tatlockia sp.]
MTYDLKKVADYAEYIANGVLVKPQDNWSSSIQLVINSLAKFKITKNNINLAYFAQALHHSADYLISKRKLGMEVTAERQNLIDYYLEQLVAYYRELNPQLKIKPPLPILEPSDIHKFTKPNLLSTARAQSRKILLEKNRKEGRECFVEIQKFVNSSAFKALDDYLNLVLNEDERDHSFFFGCFDFSEERKVNVLNQFITDLKSLSNMTEVRQYLVDFYKGKGKIYSTDHKTWDRSPFEILNTGQNITTRFFSFFGIDTVQSTTINLIDKLAKSIGYDPEVTQVLNSRASSIF